LGYDLHELPAPLPDPTKPLAEQDPVVLLAQCIWGEARGEEKQGKLAVGCVVRNRLRTRIGFGFTWNQVILQENAFSCFLEGRRQPRESHAPARWARRDGGLGLE
jgi:spore germination cell wall hydrolase CwlJ-like protein